MTRREIEEFAVGYPVPTEWVEILLQKNGYNTAKVHEILCLPQDEIAKAVQAD